MREPSEQTKQLEDDVSSSQEAATCLQQPHRALGLSLYIYLCMSHLLSFYLFFLYFCPFYSSHFPSSLDFFSNHSLISLISISHMSLHLSLSLSCLFVFPSFYFQSVFQAFSLAFPSLLFLFSYFLSLFPLSLLFISFSVALLSFSFFFPYLFLFFCFASIDCWQYEGSQHSRTPECDAILSNMIGVFEENKKMKAKPFQVLE